MRPTTLAFLVVGQLLAAEAAVACSYLPPQAYQIESDPDDETPPSPPNTRKHTARNPEESDGCGKVQSNSCHGSASLTLSVEASDDSTPADDLGYVIEVAEGDVEWVSGSFLQGPVQAHDGQIVLHWQDGDGWGLVDFELDVWTVDRAGNMSETPARVSVYLDSGRGCTTTGRGAAMPWLVLAAAWLLRRRAIPG